MPKKHYRFYMDESEIFTPEEACFCFAGVLIAEEDIVSIEQNHANFCAKWDVKAPLHYNKIRNRKAEFAWMLNSKESNRDGDAFNDDYHEFMTNQNYQVFGCAIEKENYTDVDNIKIEIKAFFGVIEAVYAFLVAKQSTASFYVESSDKFNRQLRNVFKLSKEIVFLSDEITGDLEIVSKNNPFTQIADFVAYPYARSYFDKNYRPIVLLQKKKISIERREEWRT